MPCDCGRPEGQCIKGDLDYCPALDDDQEFVQCPHCMGNCSVICHCGGDLCFCENHGDAPCPVCFGEGDVTHKRYDRYMKAQAEAHRAWREIVAKVESSTTPNES